MMGIGKDYERSELGPNSRVITRWLKIPGEKFETQYGWVNNEEWLNLEKKRVGRDGAKLVIEENLSGERRLAYT